jgi:iron-sulfur cluster repair protein YtfE (RIC family)
MSESVLLSELEEMSVNAVIQRYPETVAVFNEHGIDACCGGAERVREAAIRDGASPDALLGALLRAAGGAA